LGGNVEARVIKRTRDVQARVGNDTDTSNDTDTDTNTDACTDTDTDTRANTRAGVRRKTVEGIAGRTTDCRTRGNYSSVYRQCPPSAPATAAAE
jgi:hypothetical protein